MDNPGEAKPVETLIERACAGSGRDDQLDRDLFFYLELPPYRFADEQPGTPLAAAYPKLTTSVDAVMTAFTHALEKRNLPSADVELCFRRSELRRVKVYDPAINAWRVYKGTRPLVYAALDTIRRREGAND